MLNLGLIQEFVSYLKDIKQEYHSTTFGPYSFQVFVQAAITKKRLDGKNKVEGEQNRKFLVGRCSEILVGHGCRKRPLAEDIAKRSGDGRESKRAKKENLLQDVTTRLLRSGKRL